MNEFYKLIIKLTKFLIAALGKDLNYFLFIMFASIVLELVSGVIAIPLIFSLIGNEEGVPFELPFLSGFSSTDRLLLLSLILVFTYATVTFLRLIAMHTTFELGRRLARHTDRTLYRYIVLGYFGSVRNIDSSQMVAAVLQRSSMLALVCSRVISLLCYSAIFVAILLFLSWFNIKILLYLLGMGVLMSLAVHQITRKNIYKDSIDINVLSQAIVKNIKETVSGLREVRVAGVQDVALNRFDLENGRLRAAQREIQYYSSLPRFLVEGIGVCGLISSLAFLIYFTGDVSNSLANIGVFALLILRILPILQFLLSCFVEIRSGSALAAACLDDLKEASDNTPVGSVEKFTSLSNSFSSLEVSQVSFKFSGSKEPLFQNVSFKITEGDRILVSGPSGCGKSTLLELISGLDLPSTGKISIYCPEGRGKNLLSSIYYVSQKPLLLNDTLKDNVLLFGDQFGLDEEKALLKAIQITELNSLVDQLGGFDARKLGESGSGVSGGQGQRIALARAIVSERPIILLDEATSALNDELETAILKWLTSQEHLTIIAVSHSESIRRWFSKELKYSPNDKSFNIAEI